MAIGRPPTDVERIWIEARQNLTPEKAIERIDEHGRFLFASSSILGTLLTGFGVLQFEGIAGRLWLLVIPVGLLAISLAAAVAAMIPSYGRVQINDLDAVSEYYRARIRRGGILVVAAGIAFALSIVSVIPVYALLTAKSRVEAPPKIVIRPSYSLVPSGGDGRELTTNVEITGAPEGSRMRAALQGFNDGGAVTLATHSITSAGSEFSLAATSTVTAAERFDRFLLTVEVDRNGKPLATGILNIR